MSDVGEEFLQAAGLLNRRGFEMENFFWDSCVFNAFLYDEAHAYDVNSISQHIDEARAKKCTIYTSSIVLTEIAASKVTKKGIGTPIDFLNDLIGGCVIIDGSTNIMDLAGKLRDIHYKKPPAKPRRLQTGDAIMLATAIHLRDAFEVNIDAFHTFDDGKGNKDVPLLSYHEWCKELQGANLKLTNKVVSLNRCKPIHPAPKLLFQPPLTPPLTPPAPAAPPPGSPPAAGPPA